jgi:hypothetical protein
MTMPVVGFLCTRTPEDIPHLLTAFRRGLAENGCQAAAHGGVPSDRLLVDLAHSGLGYIVGSGH